MKQICGLAILSFFLIGCSSGKSIDEFEEEYDVTFFTEEIGDRDPDRTAQLDEDQIDGLLTYIKEYQAVEHERSGFEVLFHSDGEEGEMYVLRLEPPEREIPNYDLLRMIYFDIQFSDSSYSPRDVDSGLNGGGGLEWVQLVEPVVNRANGVWSFEVIGEWRGEFIYQGEVVKFNDENTWLVEFTIEELREMEPVGNEE
ncbi:hypothetical protein ACTHQ4_15145 [Alkalicoccobacillus gibsonii]|uniref:hypothetical protein n=1 Tax=Alkalicoccobacillus gibsonii TaxID=79881 RepID=UPI003F7CA621